MKTLVLLPHMDDEVFLLPYLVQQSLKSNTEFKFYFLTKSEGRNGKHNQLVREKESTIMLESIFLNPDFHFLGRTLNVEDLKLHENFQKVFSEIESNIDHEFQIVISPHYEGGHIDHDSAFFLAKKLADTHNLTHLTFSSYRALFKRGSFFQVAKIRAGSYSKLVKITVSKQATKHILKVPFVYKSQYKTWLAIFPFFLWNVTIRKKYFLCIPGDLSYQEKPNSGKVLYENRQDGKFEYWSKKIL